MYQFSRDHNKTINFIQSGQVAQYVEDESKQSSSNKQNSNLLSSCEQLEDEFDDDNEEFEIVKIERNLYDEDDFEIVKVDEKISRKQAYQGMSIQRSIALERAIGTPEKFIDPELTGNTLTPIFKTRKQIKAARKRELRQGRRDAIKQGLQQQKSFAAFEKFNNVLASKIMAKMGYVEGQGLGKDGQGRKEPLKTKIRPKNLGLGC